MISRFLSLTVQGELSRQPCRQLPHSTLGYPIQSTSLFDQAFSYILDHFPGSIGNPKGLLDHPVGLGLSRSSALYRTSWISYYAGLPSNHKAGKPRQCSFIYHYHYLVAMEDWSWSLHQRGRTLLRLVSYASCYCRSSE